MQPCRGVCSKAQRSGPDKHWVLSSALVITWTASSWEWSSQSFVCPLGTFALLLEEQYTAMGQWFPWGISSCFLTFLLARDSIKQSGDSFFCLFFLRLIFFSLMLCFPASASITTQSVKTEGFLSCVVPWLVHFKMYCFNLSLYKLEAGTFWMQNALTGKKVL